MRRKNKDGYMSAARPRQQKFPVFGLSEQRSWLYQPDINLLTTAVSAIVDQVLILESEIETIIDDLANIESDIDILLADSVIAFDVQSTYDSTACPGRVVVDTFEQPSITAGDLIYRSRPLVSTDSSMLLSYDATCGFIDIQAAIPGSAVTLASAAGPESLVYGTGLGPDLEIKGLSPGVTSTVTVTSPGLQDTVVLATTGLNVHLYDAVGATTPLVYSSAGPTLETKSIAAGTGISLSAPGDTVTIAASGTNVTLSSSVTGTSLVSTGTGSNLALCSLVGGPCIGVSGAGVVSLTQVGKTMGNFYDNSTMALILNAGGSFGTIPAAFTAGPTTTSDLQIVGGNTIQYVGTTTKLLKVFMSMSMFLDDAGGSVMQTIMTQTSVGSAFIASECYIRTSTQYNTAYSNFLVTAVPNDIFSIQTKTATAGLTYPLTIQVRHIVFKFDEL